MLFHSNYEDVDSTIKQNPRLPTLPPELRIKIWRLALPGPRYLRINSSPSDLHAVENEIKSRNLQDDDLYHEFHDIRTRIISPTLSIHCKFDPPVHHVCQEARAEVLRHYRSLLITPGQPAVLWDPNVDILIVLPTTVFHFDVLAAKGLELSKRIALDANTWYRFLPWKGSTLQALQNMEEIMVYAWTSSVHAETEIQGHVEVSAENATFHMQKLLNILSAKIRRPRDADSQGPKISMVDLICQ